VAAAGSDRERANLDQLSFGCAPAGAYADAASDCGAVQMLGDVWEWTSSDFTAYPRFAAFPYPEYSEVFFGDTYKVLRGGAWATRRDVIRTSFRNWDLPERRQIFAGIRCARDESVGSPRS
jgi:iron(II)-dependent oxidoreductase